jgi:AraC family transcriptional regulator of adaptative response / DNA-3-methyladenine glycosylase II
LSAAGATLRLALVPPYPATTVLDWLAARAVPGVEERAGPVFRRTLRLAGGTGIVTLEPRDDHVRATLSGVAATDEAEALAGGRRMLDLDADPRGPAAVLGADPVLAPLLARRPGIRVPGAADGFEAAARAVLGQGVTLAAARALAARLVREHGEPLPAPSGALTHAFPRAEALTEAPAGMPRARGAALLALAREAAAGRLDLSAGADPAAAERALLAIRGIGPWTASYVALRALGDRDAFPASDLGLRRAARDLGLPQDPAGLAAHAERWRPWRACAAHLLWAHDRIDCSASHTTGRGP